MDISKFIETNLDSFIQIYIKERKEKGFGCLFLNINNETQNMDCRFFPLNEINFSEEIYNSFKGFKETNKDSIMYITVVEQLENKDENYHILQYDLDTKLYKE